MQPNRVQPTPPNGGESRSDRTAAYDAADSAPHAASARRPRSAAVVGLGYVGLPTALALRENGARVIGLDSSRARLAAIRRRDVDLIPADHARLSTTVEDESFNLTTDARALRHADVVMVCVPTPIDEHQNPDLAMLRGACAMVVEHARHGQTIILTSTSYAGSTRELLAEPLQARGFVPGEDIFIASSPERIDPGNRSFPQDSVPRVVGGITAECTRRAAETVRLVTPLVHVVSSPEAAEMTKLYENAFRAVNIAFANEIADVCGQMGLDPSEVINAAATKPYGFMRFTPGAGIGGHCIPCDPHYLLWQLSADRIAAPLLTQAMAQVAARPGQIADQVIATLSDAGLGVIGARVLVVGVAYKPGVRDIRESPGLAILRDLMDREALVDYHDPLVPAVRLDAHRVLLSNPTPDASAYDLVLVVTTHPDVDYRWLEHAKLLVDPSGRHAIKRTAAPFLVEDQSAQAHDGGADDHEDLPMRKVAEEPAAFSVGS